MVIKERARHIESAVYRIVASLVPPKLENLEDVVTGAYRPFDVVERIAWDHPESSHPALYLQPLVMLDDAHQLHPAQHDALHRWLLKRELPIARWLISRLDVMNPQQALAALTRREDREKVEVPGVTLARDTTEVLFQEASRSEQRKVFRSMAKDISRRYLRRMPLFRDRSLENLGDLLSTRPDKLSGTDVRRIEQEVVSAQKQLRVTDERKKELLGKVDTYLAEQELDYPELRWAMLKILMHRYSKRAPQSLLFEGFAPDDPEPARPLKADADILQAANLQLLHQHKRPFFYGIDALCDASSENTEQFLRLSARLVETSANRIARQKTPSLDPARQHHLLTERARRIVLDWNFPECLPTRRMVDEIARRCLDKSLEPNAPLGPGANAYGILQDEFASLPKDKPALASVLKYAVAYNAITLVPYYECKGRQWCLLELGGMMLLQTGLTLRRGGFIEGTARDLSNMIEAERSPSV